MRHYQQRRAAVALGAAAALVMILLSQGAEPAYAANPEQLWQAPEAGEESNSSSAGKLFNPQAVGANTLNGHIFVAENRNDRISEFSSWGEFIRAWGWGVDTGAPELQSCTEASGCGPGVAGGGAGQLENPDGVVVDDVGSVYVYEDSNHRIQKFTANGEFVWMVGGKVNHTTSSNLCTAASGDSCGSGVAGEGPGEFSPSGGSLAVSDGKIFAGDKGRIQIVNPDGGIEGEILLQGGLAGKGIAALSVSPSGGFYAVVAGLNKVQRIDSSGTAVAELDTSGPAAVATDSAGNAYVIDHDGGGFTGADEVLKFTPSGTCVICHGDKFATALPVPGQDATVSLTGIATNVLGDGTTAPGDIYVTAFSDTSFGNRSYVAAYGPLPRFEPAPARAPKVRGQAALEVGITAATVTAEINPRFFADSMYHVEYGVSPCSDGGCTSTTSSRSLGFERNTFASAAPVELKGLQPGVLYHYRFVATNGPKTVHGEGEDEAGVPKEVEKTFRTRSGSKFLLPDGRRFEMVSPPAKNNGDVGGNVELTVAPHQAAPDGEAITYATFAAFGANPKGASGGSQYVSRRTDQGWVTENITPPSHEGFISPPVRSMSEDLSRAVFGVLDPPLTEGAPLNTENLYLWESFPEELELVTNVTPEFKITYCANIAGASTDYRHIFFTAKGKLTPEAPVADGQNLYEWNAANGIRLVSILPNEKPATPTNFNAFGSASQGCELGLNTLNHAISSDGAKAFFTISSPDDRLFVRIDGSKTLRLDTPEGGPGPAGNAQFRGASSDGSFAFFTAPGRLTGGSAPDGLYRFNTDAALGDRLTSLTPGIGSAGVLGVLGTSDDGSAVYFAATGALAAGAVEGSPNLYLWRDGEGLRFVTTLAPEDKSNWSSSSSAQTAASTHDGQSLAFLSQASLTGYDNIGQVTGQPTRQAYLYDSAAGLLTCVSCNPTGARPLGGAKLPVWSRPFQQPRYLSKEGGRLLFMSSDALDLHDINDRQDVYEFERPGVGDCTVEAPAYSQEAHGCIHLISTGTNVRDSVLIDASTNGDDVFIATVEKLVGWDTDERFDIYDARVSGGFPEPPPPSPDCAGDACRSPQQPPAFTPPPTSASVEGTNAVEPKKKRAKAKKKPRKHKHKHKRAPGKSKNKGGRK